MSGRQQDLNNHYREERGEMQWMEWVEWMEWNGWNGTEGVGGMGGMEPSECADGTELKLLAKTLLSFLLSLPNIRTSSSVTVLVRSQPQRQQAFQGHS